MQSEDDILDQLQKDISTLLQSPPSYMRQISRISQKIASLEIKQICFVLNKIHQILHDPNIPIKKKLFAFRFVKDTLLLASHSFYIMVVIRILPFMVEVLTEASQNTDNGLDFLIKKIGPKPEVSNMVEVKTFSATLLQLINEIMKWTGTHIKLHPFYKIPFPSIFKLYMDCLPKVKAMKITDLTYFTTDSVNIYEHNYLQQELKSQEEHIKQATFIDLLINNWISLPQDDEEKTGSLKLLQNIVETADSDFIRHIVNSLKPLIESEITGFEAIELVHALLKVKEIEFWILARDQLLVWIGHYILMMNKQKFSKLQNIDLLEILRQIFIWKMHAIKLGLKTETFDEFFRKMKNQSICASESEYASNTSKIEQNFERFEYYLSQTQLENINEEKKKNLNLKDNFSTINKISSLQYVKQRKSHKQDSYISEKPQFKDKSNLSMQKEYFNEISSLNKKQKSDQAVEEPRVTFVTIQSPSPIKQLEQKHIQNDINNNEERPLKVNEEYIQFNNSLHNLSSSKEIQNPKIQNRFENNIYTSKQNYEQKKSLLSKSRSIRSNKSSNKSLERLQKASSLGLGVQRVKSSKFINDYGIEFNNENKAFAEKNLQKLKIIEVNHSSQQIHSNNIQSARYQDSMSSDNFPYKQKDSKIHKRQKNDSLESSQLLNSSYKKLKNQQVIFVEETIKKPKFAFSNSQLDEDKTEKSSFQRLEFKKSPEKDIFLSDSSLKSFKADLQLISHEKASQYSEIPSDFNGVLGKKHKNKSKISENHSDLAIKFNKFPHKVKQLEHEIEKAKEYQKLYQQKMRQKDDYYENLVKNLPSEHERVHQENRKLRNELEQKQRKQIQKQAKREQRFYRSPHSKIKPKEQIPFLPSKIFSLGQIKLYDPVLVKQFISTKCLLYKNQIFELGYAFKNAKQGENSSSKEKRYSICLYFKFKVKCNKMEFKLKNESLILKDVLEAKVMNIVANKQLKFEQKIVGYTIKNEDFRVPCLELEVSPGQMIISQINAIKRKQRQPELDLKYQIVIPCTLFNFFQFHSPIQKIETIKTKYAIQPQFCNKQFATSLKGEYLLNSFKCGRWQEVQGQKQGGFYVSLDSYLKSIKDPKQLKDKDVKVMFEEFNKLERKTINFYIRKLNEKMFYIESDNQFEADKLALVEISKVLGR